MNYATYFHFLLLLSSEIFMLLMHLDFFFSKPCLEIGNILFYTLYGILINLYQHPMMQYMLRDCHYLFAWYCHSWLFWWRWMSFIPGYLSFAQNILYAWINIVNLYEIDSFCMHDSLLSDISDDAFQTWADCLFVKLVINPPVNAGISSFLFWCLLASRNWWLWFHHEFVINDIQSQKLFPVMRGWSTEIY